MRDYIFMTEEAFTKLSEYMAENEYKLNSDFEYSDDQKYICYQADDMSVEHDFLDGCALLDIGYVSEDGELDMIYKYMEEEEYDVCFEELPNKKNARLFQQFCEANTPNGAPVVTPEIRKIRRFLKKCPYKQFEQEMQERVVGHDSDVKKMATNVYLYLTSIARCNGKPIRNNFLLAGLSGSGKTHFVRSLQVVFEKYRFEFGVFIFDATSICNEGYKGKNMSNVLDEINSMLEGDKYCIVVFDELDKRLLPSYDSNHINVNREIQGDFLTVIEGSVRKCKSVAWTSYLDTSNILFVGLGAFQFIRDSEEKKSKEVPIGFAGENNAEPFDVNTISLKNIVDYGSSPELVGRFSGGLFNFAKPDKEAIKSIIQRIAEETVDGMSIRVVVSEQALDEFAELSQSEYGVRMIRERLVTTIQPLIRDVLLSEEDMQYVFTINAVGDATLTVDEGNQTPTSCK